MYCLKCGAPNPDNSSCCSQCGTHFASTALKSGAVQIAQSGIVKGLLVLWGQWFVMPLRTLKLTAQQLRQLGAAGAMELSSDIPHLTWLRIAGGTLACVGIFIALIAGTFEALSSLGEIRYSAGSAILKFFGFLLAGGFGAIAIDWAIMTGMVEGLGLVVGIANNMKKMADRT